ncbi:MAG: hypothetical protein IKY82_01325 [Alistipes sp.]|nr:hypothetical protein [Alistipes sp.]
MKNLFGRNFLGVIFWLAPTLLIIAAVIAAAMAGCLPAGNINVSDFYSSFIALCTTFIVGFQIYSSMELNNKIKELDEKSIALEQKAKQLEEMNKNLIKKALQNEYYNAYTIGLTHFNNASSQPQYYWNSMRAYCNALQCATEGGHDPLKEAFEAISKKLICCIDNIKSVHANTDNIVDGNDNLPAFDIRLIIINEVSNAINAIDTNIKDKKDIESISYNYRKFKNEFFSFINDYKEY